MREPSYDIFMMNLNPYPDPTAMSTNAHNHHFYNLCFVSQQHGPQDEVDHIEQANSCIFRAMTPIYLRAAQELLNEIVSVGDDRHGPKEERRMSKEESVIYGNVEISAGHNPGVATYHHELDMKKAKLIAMVQKVEQRYKQYQDQMQTIVSLFEEVAGLGSANTYTHMALQTISKQFRAVKDMICLQIKYINKLLGKKECDKQFGKMAHQTHSSPWRPQRGLPERAVSVLRSWLFEHFLHPYPRDLDKVMLAKQTGLTKSQVSNWFINARVRLWKPMVEGLYIEEMENEENRKGRNPNEHSTKGSSSKQLYNNTTSDESSNSMLPIFHQGFNENAMQNLSSCCSVVRFKKQNINQAYNFIHFNGELENYNKMVGNGGSLSLSLQPHSCDQTFNNIQFGSTSHETEVSGIYSSSSYQIMD